jgi:hypothetical protein
MKRVVALAVVLAAIYFGGVEGGFIPSQQGGTSASSADQVSAAFENRQSNVQVQGSGAVTRMLPDDNDGSRHQRFIIQLRSGQTVLVAHNIDLAERVAPLEVGDRVEFCGEYEWNEKGGVLHWTHRDPQHRHVDGWIRKAK